MAGSAAAAAAAAAVVAAAAGKRKAHEAQAERGEEPGPPGRFVMGGGGHGVPLVYGLRIAPECLHEARTVLWSIKRLGHKL
jgi:hypothetical protein